MKTELANTAKSAVVVDERTIVEYMDATGLTSTLLPTEKKMFMNLCTLYGLNPFKREIYCTAFGQGQNRQCSIVTGYEVYLKRAERTGKLDGYNVDTTLDEKGTPIKSTVTIYRKDWEHPFKHTVYFKEYVQRKKDGTVNKFWAEKPVTMIEKVAKAQAFRLCFPDDFDGMPYTHEEMSNLDSSSIDAKQVSEPSRVEPQKNDDIQFTVNEPDDKVRRELEELVDKYAVQLHGNPYKMAKDCISTGTESDMVAMIARVKTYLGKMGINL